MFEFPFYCGLLFSRYRDTSPMFFNNTLYNALGLIRDCVWGVIKCNLAYQKFGMQLKSFSS